MNDISEYLTKEEEEECSKMNIEEMKGRPLFALLSNEMNRTRKKRDGERERKKAEGKKRRDEKKKKKNEKIQLLFRMTATDELYIFFAFQMERETADDGEKAVDTNGRYTSRWIFEINAWKKMSAVSLC